MPVGVVLDSLAAHGKELASSTKEGVVVLNGFRVWRGLEIIKVVEEQNLVVIDFEALPYAPAPSISEKNPIRCSFSERHQIPSPPCQSAMCTASGNNSINVANSGPDHSLAIEANLAAAHVNNGVISRPRPALSGRSRPSPRSRLGTAKTRRFGWVLERQWVHEVRLIA